MNLNNAAQLIRRNARWLLRLTALFFIKNAPIFIKANTDNNKPEAIMRKKTSCTISSVSKTIQGNARWLLRLTGLSYLTDATSYVDISYQCTLSRLIQLIIMTWLNLYSPFLMACNGVDTVALFSDAQKVRSVLALTHNKEHDFKELYPDVSEIAQRHILKNCNVAGIMIDLANAGFELSKKQNHYTYSGREPFDDEVITQHAHFYASIKLKKDWLDWIPPIFQLQIAHETGHVIYVKAIFIYVGSL